MTTEHWRDIPGYEGRYQVSNEGRVRNHGGWILARNKQNSGYFIVHLYKGARTTRKPYLVHRLVLAAFVGPSEQDANHLDGDKANNALTNLEYVTREQNMQHAVAVGLQVAPRKAVVGTPLGGGEPVRFDSQLAVELHFRGKATGVVARCIAGKCGSAYGYVWSRA